MKTVFVTLVLLALMVTSALADGCVDIFFEVPSVVHPGDIVTVSGGITNCGDTPGVAHLEASLSYNGEPLPMQAKAHVKLAAGETKAYELTGVEIPPTAMPGTYEICVTAKLKGAIDTECATIEVVE
jgi:uncharacterized membrane protein